VLLIKAVAVPQPTDLALDRAGDLYFFLSWVLNESFLRRVSFLCGVGTKTLGYVCHVRGFLLEVCTRASRWALES